MPDLALTALRLSHFRSYARVDLQFDGRPVALFGQNGAGKTNLLEAVSLISPGRGLRRARAQDMVRGPENIGWRVTAYVQSHGQIHEVETGLDTANGARKVVLDGKTVPQVALGRVARVLWLVPVMDRLWLEGAGERRAFLDRIALSFDPSHADAVLAYEKAMRERNRLLRDQVREPSWFAALEDQMGQHGVAVAAGRQNAVDRLEQAQAAAETAFPRATLAIAAGEGMDGVTTPADLGGAIAQSRARDFGAGRTLVGPHRADLDATYATKNMAARLCSTGEQKALLVSLILASARALAADFGAPPILLLDEVAAHLDVDRRAALYDEIVGLGAQAFLSGTEASLFAELGDRAARLEISETNGISEAQQC